MNFLNFASFLAASLVGTSMVVNAQAPTVTKDIPTTAIEAGAFGTLVTALTATDLVNPLSAPNGPYTVFAPTDDAFAKLPEGLVGCLLRDDNLPVLESILMYHVVAGNVFANDLEDGMEIPTLYSEKVLPEEISVSIEGVSVVLNGSTKVVTPDVVAENGIIHIIDEVLVPAVIDVPAFLETCGETVGEVSETVETELLDIPGTAVDAKLFETLVAALSAADLVGTLSEPNGPYTVFAPTDEAFAALDNGIVDCLLENEKLLSDVLLYHVASGTAVSSNLSDGQSVETLLGDAKVTVKINDGGVFINKAKVILPDVMASNGVVHVIDQVLVPGRHNLNRLCFPEEEEPSPPSNMNGSKAVCSYLGVGRSAGQYLTGPTHTCLCTARGHWINCQPNRHTKKSIEQVVVASDKLTTLEAAIRKAGILGVLDGPGPFTVFAPTDRAFSKVPSKLLDFLLEDGNESVLATVLQYHVYSGKVKSASIADGSSSVPTLLGGSDKIRVEKNCLSAFDTCDDTYSIVLNDSSYVVEADVDTSNGIIHVIEEVLIPPSLESAVADILA